MFLIGSLAMTNSVKAQENGELTGTITEVHDNGSNGGTWFNTSEIEGIGKITYDVSYEDDEAIYTFNIIGLDSSRGDNFALVFDTNNDGTSDFQVSYRGDYEYKFKYVQDGSWTDWKATTGVKGKDEEWFPLGSRGIRVYKDYETFKLSVPMVMLGGAESSYKFGFQGRFVTEEPGQYKHPTYQYPRDFTWGENWVSSESFKEINTPEAPKELDVVTQKLEKEWGSESNKLDRGLKTKVEKTKKYIEFRASSPYDESMLTFGFDKDADGEAELQIKHTGKKWKALENSGSWVETEIPKSFKTKRNANLGVVKVPYSYLGGEDSEYKFGVDANKKGSSGQVFYPVSWNLWSPFDDRSNYVSSENYKLMEVPEKPKMKKKEKEDQGPPTIPVLMIYTYDNKKEMDNTHGVSVAISKGKEFDEVYKSENSNGNGCANFIVPSDQWYTVQAYNGDGEVIAQKSIYKPGILRGERLFVD